jgi:hypothetical protein
VKVGSPVPAMQRMAARASLLAQWPSGKVALSMGGNPFRPDYLDGKTSPYAHAASQSRGETGMNPRYE